MDRLLIVLGAGIGLGLALVIAGAITPRVSLAALAANLEPTPHQSTSHRRPWLAWGARLQGSRIPTAELDLIGETRERFLTLRVGFALAGALLPPAGVTLLVAVGWPIPFVATTATALAGAAAGWQIPPLLVKTQAKAARRTFRRGLAAYFDLVALERQADRGPVEALEHPTQIGRSWAFERLRAEIDRARRHGEPPWHALRHLAHQVGIDELDDLGSILTLSEEEGASIVESLAAKAASMRQRLLAEDLTAAHERNRLLDLPLALMGMTIVLFLIFPGLYLLVTT